MDRYSYRWCMVPLCTNTSISALDKLFLPVPSKPNIRRKWLQLARRKDARQISTKTPLYFCEDHFDLQNDMQNYTQYKIMGSVNNIRMVPGCLPSRFDCQPDRKSRLSSTETTRPLVLKRQRFEQIKEAEGSIQIAEEGNLCETNNQTIESSIQIAEEGNVCETDNQTNLDNLPITLDASDMPTIVESVPGPSRTQNRGIQISIKRPYRSKAAQTASKLRNTMTSPIRKYTVNANTSPFKDNIHATTSISASMKKPISIQEEPMSDSDRVSSISVCGSPSPSYVASLQSKTSSDCSSLNEADAKLEKEHMLKLALQNTLRKIINRPRFYIGIPKDCYFLIDIINKKTNIPVEHLLMCLKKIRLDTKLTELADEFGLSPSNASKIFKKSIPIIAKSLESFIVKINTENAKQNIKKCLPMAFRHNYNNVNCIIDCFEIEIQKPTKAVHQALTWSEYKKGNTIKYLISSTPDGLVNYISPGYGGRISDIMLVEHCNFLNELCPGSHILADRGFKNIEQLLLQKGCHLLRPPSVATGTRLSKNEARKTKQIASLRIHVERLIRRVREFTMLKPHSVVSSKLIYLLDECVVIACALINLQDSIVR